MHGHITMTPLNFFSLRASTQGAAIDVTTRMLSTQIRASAGTYFNKPDMACIDSRCLRGCNENFRMLSVVFVDNGHFVARLGMRFDHTRSVAMKRVRLGSLMVAHCMTTKLRQAQRVFAENSEVMIASGRPCGKLRPILSVLIDDCEERGFMSRTSHQVARIFKMNRSPAL
jgi:hypothetical protein